MLENLVKYRWALGIFLIFICTIWGISGSSIGMWAQYLPHMEDVEEVDDGVLFGTPRAIRMDEWGTFTPMAFSQEENRGGSFPYFSQTVRATDTDMFIVYGQPVKSLLLLYRPFQAGYLLFGINGGLAFFWAARLVFLFLTAFDFFRLLTKDRRLPSFLGAVLISFAPVVQWWFFINGLVEMLIFMMGAVLALHHFLNTQTVWNKCMDTLCLVICTGGFILTFYPSWEIPFAYVVLALILWVLWENYVEKKERKERLFQKNDWRYAGTYLAILLASFSQIFKNSWDTIESVMHTAYPGNRLETGGGMARALFRYPANLFYPFTDKEFPKDGNVCEFSSFFDLFPIGLLLCILCLAAARKRGKKERLLACLLVPYGILMAWVSLPWPEFLSRISLLSMSQASRSYIVLGFLNVVFLVYALAWLDGLEKEGACIRWKGKTLWFLSGSVFVSLLLAAGVVLVCKEVHGTYLSEKKEVFIFCLLAGLFFLTIQYGKKWINILLALGLCAILFFTGGAVNPIQKGTDVIYGNALTCAIREVNDAAPGKWVVEHLEYPYTNLPIMTGAATINSTSTYPALERFYALDPERKYENCYNRYAHITVQLEQREDVYFENTAPDQLKVYLNAEKLASMGTDYVLTNRDLEDYDTEKTGFQKEKEIFGYAIYKVYQKP